MNIRTAVLMTVLVNFHIVSSAFAWGYEGHEVVADIAWKNLSEEAKDGVAGILKPGEKMYSVANWADRSDVRKGEYEDTYGLHFLNIEEGERDLDIMRDSYAGANVVGAISYYAMLTGSTATTDDNRNMALKWLIHFVGDIHQPMHVSYKSDFGGGTIKVKWQGQSKKLHTLWDSLMIDRAMPPEGWQAYAKGLNKEITDTEKAEWDDNDPLKWAKESVVLAFSQGYDPTSGSSPTTITDAYYEENILIVQKRLKKAGVRLAGILNRIFD